MKTTVATLGLAILVAIPLLAVDAKMGPLDNGRTIFQTGSDIYGHKTVAQQRPLMASCAACHRIDGSGGLKFPGGAKSADLRRKALSSVKPPYTLALLERAISKGIDNEGKPLDKVMPRWKLSTRDLHDVALYVQSLK